MNFTLRKSATIKCRCRKNDIVRMCAEVGIWIIFQSLLLEYWRLLLASCSTDISGVHVFFLIICETSCATESWILHVHKFGSSYMYTWADYYGMLFRICSINNSTGICNHCHTAQLACNDVHPCFYLCCCSCCFPTYAVLAGQILQ